MKANRYIHGLFTPITCFKHCTRVLKLKEGQERSVRSAKATTDIMTGEMILKVKPDGSARVQKLGFKRPGNVSVEGRVTDKAERAESFLKRSFNKSKGLAAAKILKMARFVLNNKN